MKRKWEQAYMRHKPLVERGGGMDFAQSGIFRPRKSWHSKEPPVAAKTADTERVFALNRMPLGEGASGLITVSKSLRYIATSRKRLAVVNKYLRRCDYSLSYPAILHIFALFCVISPYFAISLSELIFSRNRAFRLLCDVVLYARKNIWTWGSSPISVSNTHLYAKTPAVKRLGNWANVGMLRRLFVYTQL